jgi:hypothetical protein
LIEALLGCPDVANAIKQFIKVICPDGPAFLEPLIIHRKDFDQILPQPLRRPPSELRAAENTIGSGIAVLQSAFLYHAFARFVHSLLSYFLLLFPILHLKVPPGPPSVFSDKSVPKVTRLYRLPSEKSVLV